VVEVFRLQIRDIVFNRPFKASLIQWLGSQDASALVSQYPIVSETLGCKPPQES
jgi:hypothetical protein